ncbi:MAG: DUF1307 domain-containing protein [Suipraeoptans sp.]
MKRKRAIGIVAIMIIMLLSGCGKEKGDNKESAICTLEQEGVSFTVEYEAEDDAINKITRESIVSLENFTEEQIEAMLSSEDAASAVYDEIEGSTYKLERDEDSLIETVVMEINEDSISQLIGRGALEVSSEDTTKLSLNETLEGLEESGWTIEK